MGKIGWSELLIIVIIAAIVLGPEKLPELGHALGKMIRSVKKYVNEAAEELGGDEQLKSIREDMQSIERDVQDLGRGLERSIEQTMTAETKAAPPDKTDAADGAQSEPETVPENAPETADAVPNEQEN